MIIDSCADLSRTLLPSPLPAEKPKEAIEMYMHNQDWESAMRVAEQFDPTSITDILVAQARSLIDRKQYSVAESVYLKAKRPDLALKMYRDAKLWHDALRIAENYLPAKVRVPAVPAGVGVGFVLGLDL